MKAQFIIAVLLLSTFQSTAQNLNLTNQKSIGGSGYDHQQIYNAPNGNGYFLIGTSDSDISGDKSENSRGGTDIWITRLLDDFTVTWDKTIGGNGNDYCQNLIFENNKIFIASWSESGISGEKTTSNFGSTDIWVLCLDTSANILWQNEYGGDSGDGIPEILNFTDSSLLLITTSFSGISGNKTLPILPNQSDIWIIEVSKQDGHIIKQKSYGSNYSEGFHSSLVSSTNGHVFIACESYPGISGDKTDAGYGPSYLDDIWIVELDENLNFVKDKCFGGIGWERYPSIIENSGFLFLTSNSASGVSGNKTSPHYGDMSTDDIWLLKLNHNLNIIWDKNFGGTDIESSSALISNANNNLILSTHSMSSIGGNKTTPNYGPFNTWDVWTVVLNSDGNILHQESFGGTEDEFINNYNGPIKYQYNSIQNLLFCVLSTSNISGNKTVTTNGGTDTWIAKINASNFLNTESLTHSISTITVSPNPFQNTVRFQFSEQTENTVLSIYAVDGKKVFEQAIQPGTTSLDWQAETTGQMFFYELRGNETFVQGKLVKM